MTQFVQKSTLERMYFKTNGWKLQVSNQLAIQRFTS